MITPSLMLQISRTYGDPNEIFCSWNIEKTIQINTPQYDMILCFHKKTQNMKYNTSGNIKDLNYIRNDFIRIDNITKLLLCWSSFSYRQTHWVRLLAASHWIASQLGCHINVTFHCCFDHSVMLPISVEASTCCQWVISVSPGSSSHE